MNLDIKEWRVRYQIIHSGECSERNILSSRSQIFRDPSWVSLWFDSVPFFHTYHVILSLSEFCFSMSIESVSVSASVSVSVFSLQDAHSALHFMDFGPLNISLNFSHSDFIFLVSHTILKENISLTLFNLLHVYKIMGNSNLYPFSLQSLWSRQRIHNLCQRSLQASQGSQPTSVDNIKASWRYLW